MAKFDKKKLEKVNANTMQYTTDKGLARWHMNPKFAVVTRVRGRHECNNEDEFIELIKKHLLTQ